MTVGLALQRPNAHTPQAAIRPFPKRVTDEHEHCQSSCVYLSRINGNITDYNLLRMLTTQAVPFVPAIIATATDLVTVVIVLSLPQELSVQSRALPDRHIRAGAVTGDSLSGDLACPRCYCLSSACGWRASPSACSTFRQSWRRGGPWCGGWNIPCHRAVTPTERHS